MLCQRRQSFFHKFNWIKCCKRNVYCVQMDCKVLIALGNTSVTLAFDFTNKQVTRLRVNISIHTFIWVYEQAMKNSEVLNGIVTFCLWTLCPLKKLAVSKLTNRIANNNLSVHFYAWRHFCYIMTFVYCLYFWQKPEKIIPQKIM